MSAEVFELIRARDLDGLRALLARDPGAAATRDAQGMSALMRAAYVGSPPIAAAVRAVTSPSDIFEAAQYGDLGAVVGDPNVLSPDGFTPLHYAAAAGHVEIIRTLVALGADLEAMSAHRFAKVRPLHSACALELSTGSADVVRVLLELGADPNGLAENGCRPLHSASFEDGSVELVRLLLGAGADPTARTTDGRSAADVTTNPEIRGLLTET